MNMNYSEQASAMTKMYRQRLTAICEQLGVSPMSQIGADWILTELDAYNTKASDKALAENLKLFYMVVRMNDFVWVDANDLHHKLKYAVRAHLLQLMFHDRNWTAEKFETVLNNTAEQIKRS